MKFLRQIVYNKKLIIGLWCSVILLVSIKHNFLSEPHNNYLIYKYAYLHAIEKVHLYTINHAEHFDKNHYGPFFSLLFAPFASCPDWLGEFLFVGLSVLLLLWAIYSLPLKQWQKNGILLISLNELLTAGFNVQFNIIIAAVILLSYTLTKNQKEWIAPLPMLVGTFVKLYGIVSLAFFFFVKNKWKYILSCIIWSIVLFLAPMIITSPDYIMSMYKEWFYVLVEKNGENVSLTSAQDISVMGFFRRTFGDPTIPNLPFMLGGVIIFGLPYLRISQYKQPAYQLLLVASTLMFPILFSSSSEGSTYIIVFVGIALWFVIQPQPYQWHHWVLLGLVVFFATLNSTDIYPRALRDFMRLHAIKAIPCTLVWLRVIYEMLTKDFTTYNVPQTINNKSLQQPTSSTSP